MKARHVEPSSRLCSVASIAASAPRPMRRPLRRAAITLESLTTRASPGSGRSATIPSASEGAPPGRTTKSRAASRGLAGRSAMRSAGRSKSKRSVRISTSQGAEDQRERRRRLDAPPSRGMTMEIVAGPDALRPHGRLDDLVGIGDRLAALDLVDVFHAFDDVAPGGVLPIEEGRVVKADEELAVAGVRIGGARHRHGAAHMRLLVELGLEVLARAAGAGALGATGLRHEAVDDPVKHDAVIEALFHQFLDAGDMAGRQVRAHGDHHIALGGFQRERVFRLCHRVKPFNCEIYVAPYLAPYLASAAT